MSADITDLRSKLADKWWRMNNLYLILDEDGNTIPFKLRPEQETFLKNKTHRNFVPKARKLGLSTVIIIENLDECLFTADMRVGIIDLKRDDAYDKLEIARFAWSRGHLHPNKSVALLWKQIKEFNETVMDNASRMKWRNGSIMSAGTSYTGKTPQRLHVSEYGPISATSASKAQAIKRGSINSVPPDGEVTIETTMEGGQFGECYNLFKLALENEKKSPDARNKMDWKMQFFSWLLHPSYILENAKPSKQETIEYFAKIKKEHGIDVPLERQAWYEVKKAEQQEDIYQQYPTTLEECDRQIVPGQIYPIMKKIRAEQRVTDFNHLPGLPIFTAWDLGSTDNMAGWLVQPQGLKHLFIDWCAGEGAGAGGVAGVIRAWEEEFGPIAGHLLPHDAELTDKGSGKTYIAQLVEAGISRNKVTIVPRIPDKWVGIEEVRNILRNSWFHERTDRQIVQKDGVTLPSGVQRLEGYRKKIDRSTGILKPVVVDDICSHTADGVRTYAEALSRDLVQADTDNGREGGVVVMGGWRGRTM